MTIRHMRRAGLDYRANTPRLQAPRQLGRAFKASSLRPCGYSPRRAVRAQPVCGWFLHPGDSLVFGSGNAACQNRCALISARFNACACSMREGQAA